METKRRDRGEVLLEVNRTLNAYGIPLWTDLRRIGKTSETETEILGVERVVHEEPRRYIEVLFRVQFADGNFGTDTRRFNTRPSALICLVVDGRVLLVTQHRRGVGRWLVELPRGWLDLPWSHAPEAAVGALLAEKCGRAWTDGLVFSHGPAHVGTLFEDSATRADELPVYYAEATNSVPLPDRHGIYRPRLYSWEQLDDMGDKNVFGDEKTEAALMKVARHRKRNRLAA